jgi:hypothetical protein
MKPDEIDLNKIEKGSYLLPDPGGEVVRDLIGRMRSLREQASALVWRMDEIHADPLYHAVWMSAGIHGIDYSDGPTYEAELGALRTALGIPEPKGE